MRKVLLKLWLGLALLAAADARAGQIISDQGVFAASATYQGPGDIVSGASFWGSCARAYTAAFAATAAAICDVVDSATGLVTCTFHVQTTGFVNPAECNGTACATACKVTKLYDQSGNGIHFTQATLGNMPVLTVSSLNSLPGMTFTAASSHFLVSSSLTMSQQYSLSVIFKKTTAGNNGGLIEGSVATSGLRGSFNNNFMVIESGSVIGVAANDNAYHAANGTFNNASSALNVDGTDSTGLSTGTNSIGTAIWIGKSTAGNFFAGTIMEVGGWPTGFSVQNRADVDTNQRGSNGYNF